MFGSMKQVAAASAICFASLLASSPAWAWWAEGHMQIAAVAYKQLTPAAKERIDVLLRLNPDYGKWIANAPDATTAKKWAFVNAATWADDIKTSAYGYKRDLPTDLTAGQNVGYIDKNQHDYWHFKDLAFSPDGTAIPAQPSVDALSQLNAFIAALPSSSNLTDDIRSYDLTWIIHITGDVHQPLHAVARYTHQLPGGDRGGNSENVIPASGENMSLHAYWDSIFGGYSTAPGAVSDAEGQDGLKSVGTNPELAKDLDPAHWINESAALAREYAYAAPVSLGTTSVQLPREYETNARDIARAQAALAAARLANVLNNAFQ